MSNVQAYYDQNTVTEWERLERHRTEFAVTLRALNEFLPGSVWQHNRRLCPFDAAHGR
jgi:hypothetical protein